MVGLTLAIPHPFLIVLYRGQRRADAGDVGF